MGRFLKVGRATESLGRQSRWGPGSAGKTWDEVSSLSLGTLWAPAPGLRAPGGRGQQGAGRIRGGGGPTWDERTVAVSRGPHGPLNSLKCPPFPSRRSKSLFYRCLRGKKRNLHQFLNNSLCYAISTRGPGNWLGCALRSPSFKAVCGDVTTSERPSCTSSPRAHPSFTARLCSSHGTFWGGGYYLFFFLHFKNFNEPYFLHLLIHRKTV